MKKKGALFSHSAKKFSFHIKYFFTRLGPVAMLTKAVVCLIFFRSSLHRRCPVCGWRGRTFHPYLTGDLRILPQEKCPECDASPRHRLFMLYALRNRLFAKRSTVLDFSPLPVHASFFRSVDNWRYIRTRNRGHGTDITADIRSLPLIAGSIDMIFCFHVLEHVDDDRAALREMFRVLRAGGTALIAVPVDYRLKRTLEGDACNSLRRRILYGRHDHQRQYGPDFLDRLREAGFNVTPFCAENLKEVQIRRYGLDRYEQLYIARKTGEATEQATEQEGVR
jgi:SAM-dependent methyltransferase